MVSGVGEPRVVRVNATTTYAGQTTPKDINLAEVSTTDDFSASGGPRQLVVVLRSGERVLLNGVEVDTFERAWRPIVEPAPQDSVGLTPQQRRYVQAVFDVFHTTGVWPTYPMIGRRLVREMDVRRVVEGLPPGFVNASNAWEIAHNRGEWATEAALFMPALRLCEGAEGEVAAFLAALRLCLERHFDPDLDKPEITAADLQELLGRDELLVRKVEVLLRGEPEILGNGGGDPGAADWRAAISPYIGRYRGVRTIEEYMAVRPAPSIGAASGLSGGAMSAEPLATSPAAQGLPRVFLVHGQDHGRRAEVARFLERLGLEVIILDEQPRAGRTIIESFEQHADVRYAVVLLTADDRGGRHDEPYEAQRLRARQNVIFELGYFAAKLRRSHVCVLYEGGVEIPSDYQGVLYVSLDPRGAWRLDLARELRAAGMPVDLNNV